MSDGRATTRVSLMWDEAPAGVDGEAALQALRGSLAPTQRIEVVAEPAPDVAALKVCWRFEAARWSDVPQLVVTLVLHDLSGAEVERHEIGTLPEMIPAAIEDAALGFARPARYRELMQARGMTGRILHPSERDVDPLDAHTLAMAALLCWPFANLPMHAERFVRVARATGQYAHVLFAVDLHELRGDLEAARALLADVSLHALDGAFPASSARARWGWRFTSTSAIRWGPCSCGAGRPGRATMRDGTPHGLRQRSAPR